MATEVVKLLTGVGEPLLGRVMYIDTLRARVVELPLAGLHFQKNQDHITSLLFSKNDYFLRQLHKELEHHVYPMVAEDLQVAYPNIPASYLKHFVVTNFIETLTWWLKKGKSYTEDQVVRFYLDVIEMTSTKSLEI